jgi:hypothetical protein
MPIAAALVASALHVYPIAPRLMLFAVPCVFLLVAAGASAIVMGARRIDGRVAVAVAAVLSATILFRPAEGAVQRVLNPRRSEHIRPLLDHLLEQWREGDSLYVYYGAKPAVRFYGRTYDLPHTATTQGRASRDRPRGYLEQIEAMNAGGRLWVLLSHNCPSCRVDEYAYIVDGVSRRRKLEESRRSYGSALHLFAPAEVR